MHVDRSGTITAEMNVSPMIDVLLVLIIVAILVLIFEAKFLINVPADDKKPATSAQSARALGCCSCDRCGARAGVGVIGYMP